MKTRSEVSIWKLPSTRLGGWAVGIGVAFIVMFLANSFIIPIIEIDPWRQTILPVYGILMMLCGLVSGVLGVIAIVSKRERSFLVMLTLVPGAFVLIFLLGEFLIPH